ncbi:hypothetical protein ACJJTC_018307 [Scirpophaga incertulas]
MCFFSANKIDLNSFALLTEELVKELVGPIGDRAKFSKNLKDWISLTNPNEAQQQSVSHTEVDAISDKHRAIPCAIKDIVNQEQEATSPLSFKSIEINNISTFDIIDISNCSNNNLPLKELLRQTLEGRALLRVYSESGLLSNTGRRKICNIIIKNLLEEDPDRRIHSSVLLDYAEQIKSIFSKENISTYFVPYINNTKLKIKRCAKGKLYDCLHNRKREYKDITPTKPKNTDNKKTVTTTELLEQDSVNTNLLTPSTQETTSIYAFMFLPLLLGNPVAKNKKKSWRPSKQEAREAFITHVRAATELQPTISRRKEKYATYGLTFQPTIFIVGPTFLYGNFTFY